MNNQKDKSQRKKDKTKRQEAARQAAAQKIKAKTTKSPPASDDKGNSNVSPPKRKVTTPNKKVTGGTTTLLDVLNSMPLNQKNKMVHELHEAIKENESDKGAQLEMIHLLLQPAKVRAAVFMSPKSAYPVMGHSAFVFSSTAQNHDENHMDTIIFLGDRTTHGNLPGFAVN